MTTATATPTDVKEVRLLFQARKFHVAASVQTGSGDVHRVVDVVEGVPDVLHGLGVGHDEAGEVPLSSQQVGQQPFVDHSWYPVDSAVDGVRKYR